MSIISGSSKTPQSWLPVGGGNLFQRIKAQRAAAEEAGIKIINLSIGQPAGPALWSARKEAVKLVRSNNEGLHEYQDNIVVTCPDWAQRFSAYHASSLRNPSDGLGFLPVPGIKPTIRMVIDACLQGVVGRERYGRPESLEVYTNTDPGYPTPADQCQYLINAGARITHRTLTGDHHNYFVFDLGAEIFGPGNYRLLMLNYPHNPSGAVMTAEGWHRICAWAEKNGVRVFNDAAYTGLTYPNVPSCCLAEVAVLYPGLSWAEAYSASKTIANGTGWRVGALAGSADFIGDIATIKGNTDSGLFAPAALGALHALENDIEGLQEVRDRYHHRSDVLRDSLLRRGLKQAVQPGAGFFTLWICPDSAFGESVESAEDFNAMMIARTGIVGVPFSTASGIQYIRYAVAGDAADNQLPAIEKGFDQAEVSYH